MVAMLEDSAKRGAAMVKQILSFARSSDGNMTILQPKHLLRDVEQLTRQTFPKSIEIQAQISPELWMVTVNATHLYQVLMNLCVNARDAMPEGGVLSLTAENLEVDQTYAHMHPGVQVGPYVVITIADTGVGIPPEILPQIFEPFFTTKAVGQGTGLGLASVKGMVENYGGG